MNNFYNPYNNSNNIYGTNYYGRQQMTANIQQPQFFAPQSNIQFATLDEAKAYIITPNSQMIFLDKDKQRCYLKTSDNNGQSQLEIYNLQKQDSEVKEATAQPPQVDLSEYAKNTNLSELEQKLNDFKGEITTKLNEIYKKVELKNALENINDAMK